MPKAFDAMTPKWAARIAAIFNEMPHQTGGFIFHGGWVGRRFVIRDITPVNGPVATVSKDFVTGTLTLSKEIILVPEQVVREMRSFGGSVLRRAQTGDFDVVKGCDSESHLVAVGHHVALCGHRGPWSDGQNLLDAPVTCPQCEAISRTKPKHRARLHPLTTAQKS